MHKKAYELIWLRNEIIVRISALATKMGQIRKIKAHDHAN